MVKPVKLTAHSSSPTEVAPNDWVEPSGKVITKETDLIMPLSSAIVAEKRLSAPIVEPSAGSISDTVGGGSGSPDGLRRGVSVTCAAFEWP